MQGRLPAIAVIREPAEAMADAQEAAQAALDEAWASWDEKE